MKVWIVSHTSVDAHYGKSGESQKLIGSYTTKEQAESIIENIKGNPGYIDYPEGFAIEEFVVDSELDISMLL